MRITFIHVCIILFMTAYPAHADQMTFKFKSPSFSGQNTSSHYLTIENQTFNREKAIKEEIKAYQEELEREAKRGRMRSQMLSGDKPNPFEREGRRVQ